MQNTFSIRHLPAALALPARAGQRLALPTAVLAALGAMWAAQPAAAATFTVTNTDDAGAGSLRQAIADANAAMGDDLVLFDSSVTGTITLTSGRIDIQDGVTISGPGTATLAVSGNDSSQVLYVGSLGMSSVSISDLSLVNGYAFGSQFDQQVGGCLMVNNATVSLQRVAVSDCDAFALGGGIGVDGSDVAFSLSDSRVENNYSYLYGGGVSVTGADGDVTISNSSLVGNEGYYFGGGLLLNAVGAVTISSSTVSGNSAQADAGMSVFNVNGPIGVVNSTISNNTASSGDAGGIYLSAIYGVGNRIAHSTIAGNTASNDGGGLYLAAGGLRQGRASTRNRGGRHQGLQVARENHLRWRGTGKGMVQSLTVDHTLLADNLANGVNEELAGAGGGPALTLNFSLLETATSYPFSGMGNAAPADPQLGPLQDNGGATFTHLPAAGSVVINAGDPAIVGAPGSDQRGSARILGSQIDIGAVEVNPGTASFDSLTANVNETAGSVTLSVNRSAGSDGAVSLDFTTGGGTATAGSDYSSNSGTLNWASGDSAAKQIVVTILDDPDIEADETFEVTLSNPLGGLGLSESTTATVTIVSEDALAPMPGSIQLEQAAYTIVEGTPGKAMLTINAVRSGGSDGAVSAQFATADGTAMAPGDYVSSNGTLNWGDGVAGNQSFVITVNADALTEPAETFSIALSNPQGGATLGTNASATVTIPANGIAIAPPAVIPSYDWRGLLLLLGGMLVGGWAWLRSRAGVG
ncbi:Calx-beta domain-containing protein [Pseudomarimonas arenosa]|uniref:Calx-beta domain-containing protein n=1 Tax=Pseudomarimonas arenosa TaxID=2774145 RepID=A0AAW3ZL84_9GAMM|nr:Calx-beta domain-containing protein [Pseudomarimonas arenosa]MBD8526875.1 hypothetical protein [Pseudomarimonas arenosa]